MRGFKKKYKKLILKNKQHYLLENRYLAKYGLRSKKQLGKGRYYLEKARKVYFEKQRKPLDYKNHVLKNIRFGILKQGFDLLDISLDSYFSRTLCYLVSLKKNISILEARKRITSGLVFYKNRRNRSPRSLVSLQNEKTISFK